MRRSARGIPLSINRRGVACNHQTPQAGRKAFVDAACSPFGTRANAVDSFELRPKRGLVPNALYVARWVPATIFAVFPNVKPAVLWRSAAPPSTALLGPFAARWKFALTPAPARRSPRSTRHCDRVPRGSLAAERTCDAPSANVRQPWRARIWACVETLLTLAEQQNKSDGDKALLRKRRPGARCVCVRPDAFRDDRLNMQHDRALHVVDHRSEVVRGKIAFNFG